MRRTCVLGLGLVLALAAALVALTPLQAEFARCLAPVPTTTVPPAIAPEPPATPAPEPTTLPSPTVSPKPLATPTPEPTPMATPTAALSPTPTPTVTRSPTAMAVPTATLRPEAATSYLVDSTLLTIYGRAFGVAPILGRLGSYRSFADMAADISQFYGPVSTLNDGKVVVPAVHLIYALAAPCVPPGLPAVQRDTELPRTSATAGDDDCLLYLEGTGADVEKDYIQPAAARGWQIVLDTQLGRSDPVTQVQRMIAKGYLNYDNVHVAIDPEFSSVPGHNTPGIPIGTIDAGEVNRVQQMLDDHVRRLGLRHKKILIVHQFGDANVDDGVPFMIRDKSALKTFDNVDLVIDADGFGTPDAKVSKYNRMTDPEVYPFIRFRGIKLFLPNPHEQAGHFDQPQLRFGQVFGEPTPGGLKMRYKPDVIIIA